ncbi:MAG: TetR/AcrR family transcriptional regulator [Sedimentisphaerales bacterium]|nr:TetR/AcrR family transcriptional regulator [Sedimentisphaerales bacterium]
MTEKQLQRKERERLQHRQEILNHALDLFSKYGFNNVSMQQIAETSEFAVGTLYNFFTSKEILFEELINRTGEHVVSEFMEILNRPVSEKESLLEFIRHMPNIQEKFGKIIKLYATEVGTFGSKFSNIREKSKIHEILDIKLTHIISQGIQKGIFRAVDPEIAAKSLSSILETIIFETTGRCNKETVTDMFKKVEQLFLEGLLLPKE